MTRTVVLVVLAGVALIATPVFAQSKGKVTAYDGRDKITVGGKNYEISGSRTQITIKGAKADRSQIKVGMECALTGAAGGEAKTLTC
jgi:hypothetical protein